MQKTIRISALLLALLLLSLSLLSCAQSENERAVATVGEYEILYEELRFVTMSYKKILDATYGDGIAENGTIWDDPALAQRHADELKESVMTMLEQNYRVLLSCAAYGIGRDVLEGSEIQNEVDRQMKSAEESFSSKKAFLEDMEANFMTEHLYRLYLAREQMKYRLRDAVLKDGDTDLIRDQQSFYDWLRDGNCVYVQHIFKKKGENADIAGLRLFVKEISVSLQNKEHHISEYIGNTIGEKNELFNDDPLNVAPYYLIPSLYDEELVNAGLRLYEVGDASDVIETEEGLWVLQRIEEPEGELDSQIGDLYDSYIWAKLGEDPTQGVDVKIIFNELGESIDLTAME